MTSPRALAYDRTVRRALLLLLAACSDPSLPLPMGPAPVCGDGLMQGAEACDDGARNGVTRCNLDCTLAGACGDGIVDRTEECDDGAMNSATQPGACRPACVAAGCDDGVLDPTDACIGRAYWDGPPSFFRPIADLNGDGIDELVVLILYGNGIELWESRHDGYTKAAVPDGHPGNIEAADFDGDGVLDLIATYTSSIAFLRRETSGHFAAPVVVPLPPELEDAQDAAYVEVDRGFELVVVAGIPEITDAILSEYALTEGSLALVGSRTLSIAAAGELWTLRARDVDGDGVRDLLFRRGLADSSGLPQRWSWATLREGRHRPGRRARSRHREPRRSALARARGAARAPVIR